MSKIEKFIYKNFNLTEEDKKFVPEIVAEISAGIESGEYDDAMNGIYGQISEYTLYDVFDEKLAQKLGL